MSNPGFWPYYHRILRREILKSESTKYPGVLSIISYYLKPRKQALNTEVNVSILGRQLGAADTTRCMRSAGPNGSSSQGSNFGVKMQLSREVKKQDIPF